MDSITTRFKEYDLKEISDEYRAACGPESKDVILPPKVGGSKFIYRLESKMQN